MNRSFTGMDPWLEDPAFWQDFHRYMMVEIASAILDVLPDGYDARMEESMRLVDFDDPKSISRFPDVGVTLDPEGRRRQSDRVAATGTGLLEPIAIPLRHTEEIRDVWLEVRHRDERNLVTVVELLSPSNKTGQGWADFDLRRRQLVEDRINLVEIDLLLGGRRAVLERPLPPDDYFALVTRSIGRQDERAVAEVYHWPLEAPLPALPIPLKRPDPDVILNLGPAFESTWQRGRYVRVLRYDKYVPPIAEARLAALRARLDAWRAAPSA